MPGEVHDEMEIMGQQIAASHGFDTAFRGSELNWGPYREGDEIPDVWAMASRYDALHPFECDDPIRPCDTLVIEAKATREDFLADLEKGHRSTTPTLGQWFGYVCPPDVILPGEVPMGAALWWVRDGMWDMLVHPMRRNIDNLEKTTLMMLRTMNAKRWGEVASNQPAGRRGVGSGRTPKRRKGKKLTGDAAALAAFIDERPADVGLLKKYARAKRVYVTGSPRKLANDLVACGTYEFEMVEGIPWFTLKVGGGA